MEVCATLLQVFLFSILLTDSLTYYTVKSISYVCSIICPFFDMKFFFQMEVFTALHWGGERSCTSGGTWESIWSPIMSHVSKI